MGIGRFFGRRLASQLGSALLLLAACAQAPTISSQPLDATPSDARSERDDADAAQQLSCSRLTSWRSETVKSSASNARIALGPNGEVHLLYAALDGLHYARRSPDHGWQSELIDAYDHEAVRKHTPSFAVDKDGLVHVAFFRHRRVNIERTIGRLTYAQRQQDGRWHTEAVSDETGDGSAVTLRVDSAGSVHLLYIDQRQGRLIHSLRAGSNNWQQTIVDETNTASGPSLTIDASDGLHVAYYRSERSGHLYGRGQLTYAYRSAQETHFTSETIEALQLISPTAIATHMLREKGRKAARPMVHLTYYELPLGPSTPPGWRYQARDPASGKWRKETIPLAEQTSPRSASDDPLGFAVSNSGATHFLVEPISPAGRVIYYALREADGDWTVTALVSCPEAWMLRDRPALALNASDQCAHIAFAETNGASANNTTGTTLAAPPRFDLLYLSPCLSATMH